MSRGLFVTFEGIDGCGKSTQVARTRHILAEKGIPFAVTREPGGTRIGERIRAMLLSPDNNAMCNPCEVLLYLAARAQHVCEKIRPEIDKGNVVLCDRFMDATFAYQGYGRGIALETLVGLNEFATGGIVPSVTFVFDIDVKSALARLAKAKKRSDRLENSGRKFYEEVRKGYLELASLFPKRIVVLKGSVPREDLTRSVWKTIAQRLQRQR
jgi:dTMP kinase